MKKRNILVTNVHAQQAYAVIRALRPHANRMIVCVYPKGGILSRLSHGACSRLVDRRYAVPSPVKDWQAGNVQAENSPEEEAYVQAMLDICDAESIDEIYPSWDPDVYVLSKNKDRFAGKGVMIPVPGFDVNLIALDKYRTVQAAMATGFPCPRTYLYENMDDVRKIVEKEGFPLVVKPRFTSGGHGMAIVNNVDDLAAHLSFETGDAYKPMIQEYIPGGKKESLQFVIDREGNLAFVFHKKRLRTFRVNARFGTVSRSAKLPPYYQQSAKLMTSFGWWGGGGLEVLVDSRDGSYKLMEINSRYPRQLWNRTELDINEPLMCLQIADGQTCTETAQYPRDVLFVNPVEDVMLLCLQLMDAVAYRFRNQSSGSKAFDRTIAPEPMREIMKSFMSSYRRGQTRVLDPYARHFFQDPLVSLSWWLEFTTWMSGALKKIGR